MVLREQLDNNIYRPDFMIPASFKNGKLSIGNNGISKVFFGSEPVECYEFKASQFRLYALSNPPVERPFFLTWEGDYYKEMTDEIISTCIEEIAMWELFYVYSKRKIEPNGSVKKKEIQYSCLRYCRPGTLFCKCDTCGDRFVITLQTAKFYTDRGLVIPTYRCAKCIQKKRMRYAAKNK